MFYELKLIYKEWASAETITHYSCLIDQQDEMRFKEATKMYNNYIDAHKREYYLILLQINSLDDNKQFVEVIQ